MEPPLTSAALGSIISEAIRPLVERVAVLEQSHRDHESWRDLVTGGNWAELIENKLGDTMYHAEERLANFDQRITQAEAQAVCTSAAVTERMEAVSSKMSQLESHMLTAQLSIEKAVMAELHSSMAAEELRKANTIQDLQSALSRTAEHNNNEQAAAIAHMKSTVAVEREYIRTLGSELEASTLAALKKTEAFTPVIESMQRSIATQRETTEKVSLALNLAASE